MKRKPFIYTLLLSVMLSFSTLIASDDPIPELEFTEDSFDFGEVNRDTVLQHVFTLKNTGEDTLHIKRVSSG